MSSGQEQKRELREQREAAEQADSAAHERRKRTAYLAGGIALIALIVVVGLVLVNQSDDSPDVDGTDLLADVPQQGIELGDPDAPVTVVEFADLQCPFCRDFAVEQFPDVVADYVEPGDVKMELKLLGFIPEGSAEARLVLAGAAQQDAIWPLAENVYSNQGTEGSGYLNDDFLRDQAKGIEGLDIERAIADADGEAAQKYAAESDQAAQDAGATSTPAFLVGPTGGDMELTDANGLTDAIDSALSQAGK